MDIVLTAVPLSETQRGVFFECIREPKSTAYNIPFAVKLPAGIDTDRFVAAVACVVALHPALGVTVTVDGDVPVMVPHVFPCEVARYSASDYNTAFRDFVRPFDLEHGPLFRFAVCDTPDGCFFLLDVHHLVFDGTSLHVFLQQVAAAYDGAEPDAERMSLFDVCRMPADDSDFPYYREHFADVEFDSAPLSDVGTNNVPDLNCATFRTPFVEVTAPDGVRMSTLFMAAFAYTLGKFNGVQESCFTTVNNGRRGLDLGASVGMFVKTVPLHFAFDDSTPVRDFLKYVQDEFYATICHDRVSFSRLAQELAVNNDISYVFQSDLLNGMTVGGQFAPMQQIAGSDAVSKMLCMVMKSDAGFGMYIQYRANVYSPGFVSGFAETVLEVAKGMTKAQTLGDIPLLTDYKLIDSINSTERQSDDTTVNALLDSVIERFPAKTMLVHGGRSWSFSEFDAMTRGIAAYVAGRGIGRDEFVAVLVPRSDMMVLAAWGVIRAGAAFQPLDPTYPAERLNYMVSDSGARLVIADRPLIGLLSDYHGEVLFTDELAQNASHSGLCQNPRPEDALTMIYTSGTTGKPKGCVLENRNLAAFFRNHVQVMGLDENSRIASYASFGFDAGVMDVITAPLCGGTLYIVPDEIRLDLAAIDRFYCENGITHGFMTTQLGRMFAEQTRCRTLQAFLVGGEKLVPFNPPSDFRFINGYGPCETMAYICHHTVTDNSHVQPIGLPNGNTKLYVVDPQLRMLPVGAVGELCISGAQVGRGYLGLPEKTAQVFVRNPFESDAPGYERMYRTGDMVRRLANGEIEFVGRRDGQVKIRGFRVELTEVEEVIRRFAGVSDATVAAFDDAAGGKFLAAYVVSGSAVDTDALNAFILAEKPAYMVPAVTMQIDAIPYTQNQKVNRRALPEPVRPAADDFVQPSTEVQKRIFEIAAAILGHDSFGIDTSLFMAGLTSIGTLKFNMELGKAFDCPVTMSDLMAHDTVRELEEFLSHAATSASDTGADICPLMPNQMGVLVECQMDTASLEYNIPVLFRISDNVDVVRLQQAVCAAIDAHPYMKAVLKAADDGSVCATRVSDGAVVEIVRCASLPAPDELVRPFILLGQPLYRAMVFVTQAGNYLFIDVHHIISDGTSMGVLIEDINAAYAGDTLSTESYTCFDIRPAAASDMKHFDTLLDGCNTECMPAKCPESDAPDICARYHASLTVTPQTLAGFSGNAFFNAVFSYVLSQFLHADDVTYCTIYNGRSDTRLARCFGMLVKTFPVRSIVSEDIPVRDFVLGMQKQLIGSMASDSPFAELSRLYGVKPDIFFIYQGDSFTFDNIGNMPASLVPLDISAAKAPLSVEVSLVDGVFKADVTYRTDCLCREFVESFMGAFDVAAAAFAECRLLKEVPLLCEAEREAFDKLNNTSSAFQELPAQAFVGRSDKVAVRTANASLTFAELDDMSNKVASALVSRGVRADEIVSMILERTELVPVAEIGIMKAGGAFLPMLPSYPDDRLEFCISDSGSRFLITTRDVAASHHFEGVEILWLEDLVAGPSVPCPPVTFRRDQLAYCIYTSGSTGTPKGVMIEQHNLSNFVQTAGLRELEQRGSVILCMASISFDMSVSEIFFSLAQGNTVYIASEDEIHNYDKLLKAFVDNGVDMMMMTPSFAWSLLSMPAFEKALGQLQGVVLGAEAFQPSLFARFKALNPEMLIQNGYGPTECTQACSAKTLTSGEGITIGRPYANTRFHVMNSAGLLLPRYAVGELIISGEGVCRGYVGLPEKTAAAFFDLDGVRSFRSGDLVRINRDGEAEFGGRKDNQVKLRGFRIELDEVENVMQSFPGVSQCKVLVRGTGQEAFLGAYFTADHEVALDELTAYLRTKLTYYMVPQAMMQLDRMPVTANGKLDAKALPEIRPSVRERVRRKPADGVESRICELFKSVIGLDECWPDDNFFEIGGTSLSASSVVMQLKADGLEIEYQDIFDHQTAAELAEYLSGESHTQTIVAADGADGLEEPWIREVLGSNTMDHAAEVVREPLGDVLLTGATGFLGNHVLHELLSMETGHIFCLMRKGAYESVENRLKSVLFYYFDESFEEAFASHRITVVEGDITDDSLTLSELKFDTIINCAACVKHYANDNSIEFVNVHGVENLIGIARSHGARLIQISTTSVPGVHNADTYRVNLRMTEDHLFVIDDMNNQYAQSKYKAELLVLKAVHEGDIVGKIIRVGNLMGRYSDGEFQTNMRTNAFLNGMQGFAAIGKCPISHSTDPMSFSPIDCTARAVVLLAGTNPQFTAFNADSRSTFDEMKVMEALNACGIPVVAVQDEEYYADFRRMMADPTLNAKVSALLTNDRPDVHVVNTDNRFTANVLYRIGFSWPFIDDAYLRKVITALDTLGFF